MTPEEREFMNDMRINQARGYLADLSSDAGTLKPHQVDALGDLAVLATQAWSASVKTLARKIASPEWCDCPDAEQNPHMRSLHALDTSPGGAGDRDNYAS